MVIVQCINEVMPLLKGKRIQEVEIGHYEISRRTLVSFGYTGCRALVLQGNNLGALSHSPRDQGFRYINK